MKPQAVANKLDTFMTKLMQEALRLESLKHLAEDHQAACDEIDCEIFPDPAGATTVLRGVSNALAQLDWDLTTMCGRLEEMGWKAQELQDEIEMLVLSIKE